MPEVRRATPADMADLIRLNGHVQRWHADTFPDVFKAHVDPADLTRMFCDVMADPGAALLLSQADGPPTGYLFATIVTRPESAYAYGRKRLMIEHISVAPEARRLGHGAALIDAARALARAERCGEIALDTWALNTEAHGFFRAMGLSPRRLWFHAPL